MQCTLSFYWIWQLSGSISLERTKTGLKTEGTGAKAVRLPPPPVPSLRSVTVGVVLRQVGVALRARPTCSTPAASTI